MKFCVIDTETTGLDPEYHEIIQIAAIFCDDHLNKKDTTVFKIKPRYIERASEKALQVNGYHPDTWDPTFMVMHKALSHLNHFIDKNSNGDSPLIMVGQNVQFDYDFLKDAYKREDMSFPFSELSLDLIQVAKAWSYITNNRIQRFSLTHLAEFTNQVNVKPHDAGADAEVTLDILLWFINDLKRGSKHDRRRFYKRTSIKV